MRLTTFTDFGLRALMRIASEPDRSWSTTEIAEEFDISRHHLAKAIAKLSHAGFLRTRRGGGGGAMLALPASEIRIGDVVRVLEKEQRLVECFQTEGNRCYITPVCKLKGFLATAEAAFLTALDVYTLEDCTLNATAPDFIGTEA